MASTSHLEINHDKEPVRLFRSDFLEFFTHIHPVVVLIIWIPAIVLFLVGAIVIRQGGEGSWISIPLGFLLGLFLWTLAEYGIHRFVFHFRPRASWQSGPSLGAAGFVRI
jgi:dihydroceramide fatty acyl 2-hydroxylase